MPASRSAFYCRLVFRSLPLGLAALLLAGGVAVNLVNVVGRYAFQHAFYWAEEAMIYASIWSIFLASVAVAFDRSHLTMNLFAEHLSVRWRRVLDGTMTVATIVICLFMASQSFEIIGLLVRSGQNSVALGVPMVIPQSSLLVGFVMIAAAVGCRFLLRISERDEPAVWPESAEQ